MSLVNGISNCHHDWHDDRILMYSFFKPAQQIRSENEALPESRDNEPSPFHDEGALITNASGYVAVETKCPPDGDEEYAVVESGQLIPIHIPPQSTSMQAFDPQGDRRKRRKISDGPDDRQDQIEASELITTGSLQNGVLQSQTPANQDGVVKLRTEHQPASVATPGKRRGRPPKASGIENPIKTLNNGEHIMDLSMSDLKSEVSERPVLGDSHKNKIMRISAGGKLFESSKTPCTRGFVPKPPPTSSMARKVKGTETEKKFMLKNGKFTQSLVAKIKYDLGKDIGKQIDRILSAPPTGLRPTKTKQPAISNLRGGIPGKPHPFLLSKSNRPSTVSDTASAGVSKEAVSNGAQAEDKRPVAWKELVFKSKAVVPKDTNLEKAPWPPRQYQHIGNEARPSPFAGVSMFQNRKEKTKARVQHLEVGAGEADFLQHYAMGFNAGVQLEDELRRPVRKVCTTQEAFNEFKQDGSHTREVQALSTAQNKALYGSSAFDRGEAPGPLPWTQRHAPQTWEDVLQPTCHTLFDWLRGLAVHNVKQGLDGAAGKRSPKRKKKTKKRTSELDDFIVVDDDENQDTRKAKNSILIVGPNGCGKTASVFAVAKQLGFEIFEIHAGMRRSQKDIFDKVGDMTQNHMVQRAQTLSRDSSVVQEPDLPSCHEDPEQPSIAALFGRSNKNGLKVNTRPSTPQPSKDQKQSLILFEEVDQIFEEDRGFWTGVQSLIQNSKRPVILTCNELRNVPLDELDLHTVLEYVAPSSTLVAEYLTYLAAAEGHLIRSSTIENLYRSKGCDLRAAITELDFWCQMTVGSQKGGLDWFPQAKADLTNNEQQLRIFSTDTFFDGLDLLPPNSEDTEASLRYINECMDIDVHNLIDTVTTQVPNTDTRSTQELLDILEWGSETELLHDSFQTTLAAKMHDMKLVGLDFCGPALWKHQQRQHVLSARRTTSTFFFSCLEPLCTERAVFPPAVGRLAPSLDAPRSVIASDLAPYVRSMAGYDQRLEQTKDEMFSISGKKTRTTRAARAAVEGGHKAYTRREKWLPPNLNLEAVLATGNNWPQWSDDDSSGVATEEYSQMSSSE